jgi:hypothetical protein
VQTPCQIPTWKIWFQPIGRIFHEKNGLNSPDFEKKILAIARFLLLVPIGSQKYKNNLFFSYFHISTCGQIWLNRFRDDSHLDYITKLEKETLLGHSGVRTPYYCTSHLAYGTGFGICLIWKDMEEFPT